MPPCQALPIITVHETMGGPGAGSPDGILQDRDIHPNGGQLGANGSQGESLESHNRSGFSGTPTSAGAVAQEESTGEDRPFEV